MAEEKTLVLVSSDGISFEVKESIAMQSGTIKVMMAVLRSGQPIPLLNVNVQVLSKVVKFGEARGGTGDGGSGGGAAWGHGGVGSPVCQRGSQNYGAVWGVKNQLNPPGLSQNPEWIRTLFNIQNDVTPEEEEMIQRENQGAFE